MNRLNGPSATAIIKLGEDGYSMQGKKYFCYDCTDIRF